MARLRLTRRQILTVAVVVVGLMLLFTTVPPLRHYVSGAPQRRHDADASRVIAAAGDIACSVDPGGKTAKQPTATALPTTDTGVPADARPAQRCAQKATADVVKELDPLAVLPLGDVQSDCGSKTEFSNSYDPTWGQFLSISHPVIGHQEYGKACGNNSADGYLGYFGAGRTGGERGWYSYELGDWHLIALNSQCSSGEGPQEVGGCAEGSAQERWLEADLKAHPTSCTLAYWHDPVLSSGQHGSALDMVDIWNDLVDAKADVVLSAHNHDYERFDPVGRLSVPDGTSQQIDHPVFLQPSPDPRGVQQFVVGTGGKDHDAFQVPSLSGQPVRNDSTFGVLSMTLRSDGYDWRFLPVKGDTFADSGSAKCH